METVRTTTGPRWCAAGGQGGGRHGWGGFGRHGRGAGFGGGMGPFGPRFRQTGPRVTRGDVRAAALLLLAERPMHGYQVIQEITERSDGLWQPSAGSVYPALQQLEDEGLLRGEEREGRRVFQLTDAGRAYVEEHRAELTAARDAVTGAVDDEVLVMRDLVQQIATAAGQVVQAGTSAQLAAARELLTATRRQLYRLLADGAGETE